jgi:hypothetical protein
MLLRPGFIPLLALALAALAGGCAVIDRHEKVAGWPELRIVEHYVPDEAMRKRCSKYALLPEACAEFYFDRGECHVWYSADYPPMPFVVAHERLHCQGYDHAGDTSMRDVLARYEAERAAEHRNNVAPTSAAGAGATGSGRAPRG